MLYIQTSYCVLLTIHLIYNHHLRTISLFLRYEILEKMVTYISPATYSTKLNKKLSLTYLSNPNFSSTPWYLLLHLVVHRKWQMYQKTNSRQKNNLIMIWSKFVFNELRVKLSLFCDKY